MSSSSVVAVATVVAVTLVFVAAVLVEVEEQVAFVIWQAVRATSLRNTTNAWWSSMQGFAAMPDLCGRLCCLPTHDQSFRNGEAPWQRASPGVWIANIFKCRRFQKRGALIWTPDSGALLV